MTDQNDLYYMRARYYNVSIKRFLNKRYSNRKYRRQSNINRRAEKIGGIGSLGLTERNPVGVCAEFRTVNQLLLNGSDISNIKLTVAIRPRTREIRPNCANCLEMFFDILK